jgi:hypothetical protein
LKKLFFVLIICEVFFGFLELVLWISGAETQIKKEDPFRGFSSLVKVFEREDDRYKTRYVSLHRTFTDQSFRAEKPDNGFRIFSLGGSSSCGYPWGDEVAFTEILGELIAEEHPGLEAAVREQMREWYGSQVTMWKHLRTYRITEALPDQTTGQQPLFFPGKEQAGALSLRRFLPAGIPQCGHVFGQVHSRRHCRGSCHNIGVTDIVDGARIKEIIHPFCRY